LLVKSPALLFYCKIWFRKWIFRLATKRTGKEQTKTYAWIAILVYSALFPIMLMFAVTNILIFDSPSMPVLLGLSIIFLYFCVPQSIPITFYFIWSQYAQENYKKSRQFCLLHVSFAIVAIIYDSLTNVIHLAF
jgi:hypothetical protein